MDSKCDTNLSVTVLQKTKSIYDWKRYSSVTFKWCMKCQVLEMDSRFDHLILVLSVTDYY